MNNYSTYIYDDMSKQWVNLNSDKKANILYDTKSNWNAQRTRKSVRNTIYVYSDYKAVQDEDGDFKGYIPNIKIGDGTTYLIDLPFVVDENYATIDQVTQAINDFTTHVNNHIVHITNEEREFWNNKCRVYQSEVNNDTLIFTIN